MNTHSQFGFYGDQPSEESQPREEQFADTNYSFRQ
jgi:hypothetical protein